MEPATPGPTPGDELEQRARASHLAFDYRGSMAAYEQAYGAYRREGDLLAAARAARTLGWFHGSVYGEWPVYRGWLGRALSLLEQAGADSNEHGWVLVVRAQSGDDLAEQQRLYEQAIRTARRCRDADLECEALASLGIMLTFSGHLADGMAHLDEALGAICAGDVADLSVVEGVFCGLFHACERTADVERAELWLRAADEYVQRRGFVAVGGYCRAYFGGILTAAGRWSEAEAELSAALEVFGGEHRATRDSILCRLAELRLGQGRIEEAAQLLGGCEQHDDAVRPLVGLHLARGERDVARDLVRRCLADGGADDLAEGRLLALLVEADLAEGAIDRARAAVERLTSLAGNQAGPYLAALAAAARGRLCLATGSGDARSCLDEALRGFTRARLPVETARTRLELARALAATTPAAAIAHARAALRAFEQLPAARDADAAAAVLRSLGVGRGGPRGGTTLTARETEVLALVGHGLSNAEIGRRLFISPRTAEHHVSRILAKLGLAGRAQAVAFAVTRSGKEPGRD